MLRFLTAGESHGQGLTAVVEGIPAGLALSEDDIVPDLRRRQGGYGRGGRQKIERDRARITSGVRHGFTLGSPISLWIENKDWENWQEVMAVEERDGPAKRITRLRPGHADLAGTMKYGFDDVRPILERASARETAARVAVGGVCRTFLASFGVRVNSRTVSIGEVAAHGRDDEDWDAVEASEVRCGDAATSAAMIEAIDRAREAGDTIGGVFEVVAEGVPIGLGSHVQWDRRLDGRLAQALMSIHAVKAVEIGEGLRLAATPGHDAHDVIRPDSEWDERPWSRRSNHAGGLEGGMTNGEAVIARAALKPISTLSKPLPSADLASGGQVQAHYERSDVCVVPAGGVIGEAMVAIVLAEAVLQKFGGDGMDEILRSYRAYQETVGPRGVPQPIESAETTEV
ncbi:MAG: chorismate synthase [Dehalococcoidia bacterium]|nr:chorismate synthase [Dehalococcoidia bacterium]